ncbi:hypothetical protein [Lysobacter capsici]|uniref:hypothetical protein n=1 Tax=Lysobacter capsici TaxID=435897 RepID=UPI001C006BE8|nr:hypothetical protein [Lysobacter capsici]QWF18715.1 hypothetical protein KME82_08220 [Lysobacter capsici]
MRIPKLSACCEIDIFGTHERDRHFRGPGVALRISARINGQVYAVHHELRSEMLDDNSYGEHVICQLERQIGREIVRGNTPDDPRRRVEYVMADAPSFNDEVRRTR